MALTALNAPLAPAAGGGRARWVTPPMFVVFLLLVTLPAWVGPVGLYQYLGLEIVIWMIYALGFNVLLGYSGLPSFGHGAFFGVGAYAFGLFQFHVTESLWLGLAGSVVATVIAGGLVAAFLAKRRGIYFALLTVAFGQVFWFASIKLHRVTGGEDGLLDVPRPALEFGVVALSLDDNVSLYYFTFAIFLVLAILLWRLVHSPYGKVLQAIKQNEMRASFVGYNVWLYKWSVFTLSAAISGLAGGLFAIAQQSAFPDVMNLASSGMIVMMVLIGGGFVSFWGPVVGVTIFFIARDVLGLWTETWLLWFGLMFIVIVLFKPEGVAGLWQDGVARLRHHRTAPAAPAMTDGRG